MVTWLDSTKGGMSPVTAPGAVPTDKRIPPCVGHAAYSPDYESERPGDYLEDRQPTSASRYPAPLRADLVTLWKRNGAAVLSLTADGKVHDFHLPPERLVVLLREVADILADSTILQ